MFVGGSELLTRKNNTPLPLLCTTKGAGPVKYSIIILPLINYDAGALFSNCCKGFSRVMHSSILSRCKFQSKLED